MSDQQQNGKDFDILDFASQASKFIEKNFKAFLGLFLGLIAAGVVWSFVESANKKKEQQAFSELFEVTRTYNQKKDDFTNAKNDLEKKDNPAKKEDSKKNTEKQDKPLKLATGDITKDYGAEVEKLQLFVKANQGKNASGEAALTLAEIFEEYGQSDKGAMAIETALKSWSSKNVLYYIMQMRAGDLWATSNNCEKALPFWQAVADSTSFIASQAQLKLGVCLQQLGRYAEAKIRFEQIKEKAPNSSEGFSAKRYLRFIEFKMNSDSSAEKDKAQNIPSKKDKKS